MEINNLQFLNYTVNRKMTTEEFAKTANYVSVSDNVPISLNSKPIENGISVASVGSTLSDEALEKLYMSAKVTTVANPAINGVKLSTSYRSFSPAEIMQIKTVIYNLHNSEDTDTTPTPNPNPNPNPTPDPNPNPDSGPSSSSFIKSFVDVDTMFDYLENINPEINKETGISKAQLVALTQDDDWEDANYDFFGSLNRIFDSLDTDKNLTLSYDEIKIFIGKELGEDFNAYHDKVNNVSDKIQAEYENLSEQEKLEFAIEKTREYLEASGLTNQIDALDRLLAQEDKFNTIKVGNIAIADLNVGNTSGYTNLGAYNYYAYTYDDYVNKNKETGIYKIWTDDVDFVNKDGQNQDLGITLDVSLLDGKWYELVNTLVHELTHATAYKYYADNDGSISGLVVQDLYDKNVLTDDEYNFYLDHWSNICGGNPTDEEKEMFKRLQYLLYMQWGEYAAYQVDADYNDSIGQDVYKGKYDNATTAVDGKNEKQTIDDHIKSSYDNELPPDYKWWSYA